MLKTIFIGAALLFIAILLMGMRIFFSKKGEFPNTHIGGCKAMKDRGIGCATSQDAAMHTAFSPVEKILKSNNL